jgi:ornithine carbamoyltransferase
MTDFLTIDDVEPADLHELLDLAAELKAAHHAGRPYRRLPEQTLAMLFHEPSTRTRTSFETGMTRLGGHAIMLNPEHMQLDRGEPIRDTARALSAYVDAVMIRTSDHGDIVEFAEYASVPTINGLSDDAHPCQTLADLLTIREHLGGYEGTAAWVGDGNNVARSFVTGAAMVGLDCRVATPEGFGVGEEVRERVRSYEGTVTLVDDPRAAVDGADVVYTDTWTSMHHDTGAPERRAGFEGYQLNSGLLAGSEAIVMHCLPAHRGEEITDEIIESDRSVVWQQAENRMHTQNALLVDRLA